MDAPTTKMPLLGRCKACDYALFATDEDVREADDWAGVKPGLAYRVNNGFFARCPQGHRVFPLRRIKGTYSPDHKCDARCLNAKGHTCTCSCGGANHGRGHVAAVVEAHEQRFIGEIGKHIIGTVKVVGIKDITGNYESTLHTFVTDKGDVIKWFRPSFVTKPDFEQGERVKIRAKVKDHQENNFGKATIVIYVERVEK